MRKLDRNPALAEEYDEALQDFEKEGFVEPVDPSTNSGFFLPHRPVVRQTSVSYKVRPVFDASSRDTKGVSLNDCMLQGSNLLPDLPNVLLHFRNQPFGFTTDIKRAFLQVQIVPEHRPYLQYLTKGLDGDRVLRFKRLPFGLNCAPFILNATTRHHLSLQPPSATVDDLETNLFVDDWVSGERSIPEVLTRCREGNRILDAAGMKFQGWCSNSPEVLDSLESEGMGVDRSDTTSVLGLEWKVDTDHLSLKASNDIKDILPTKRGFLSLLSRIFDPLGLLSPFAVRGKLVLQQIWGLNLKWDEPLPSELEFQFSAFQKEFLKVSELNVPRYVQHPIVGRSSELSLHLFCDASERAFGAVIYLRAVQNEEVAVNFLIAKSRVAPLNKTTSIPRLELCACLLGARLLRRVLESLFHDCFPSCYAWTDSMIALAWISEDPSRWKQYVSNRVSEIQDLVPSVQWRHCPGTNNPADICSRGTSVEKLISNQLWLHGPSWLKTEVSLWPQGVVSDVEVPEEETKKCVNASSTTLTLQTDTDVVISPQRYSSFNRLVRITAWIFRFIKNCRNSRNLMSPKKANQNKEPLLLEPEELMQAEVYWLKEEQRRNFPTEYQKLREGKTIPSKSSLILLHPQWHQEHGLLVTKGRSHPNSVTAILPPTHLAKIILQDVHRTEVCHAGAAATLAKARNQYWIIKGKSLAQKMVHGCPTCRRYQGQAYSQREAALPAFRVQEARPFETTGVDYAGPLFVKEGKAYICLFSCAITRALHVELVEDMTTPVFILALRRFLAQRGGCHTVICDNALTFKKAASLLKNVRFRFIPERAPWWGGFYERMVKTLKSALRKILGRSCLSFRELETAIKEIAAAINHRPLLVPSSSPTDSPLTPNHFLDGAPPSTLNRQEPSFTENPDILLNRYHRKQVLLQQTWKRWRTEYLQALHQWRTKPVDPNRCPLLPAVGDVVLIEQEGYQRGLWPLARVQELITGSDGFIRAVMVKKSDGTLLRRPTSKVYPLEMGNPWQPTDIQSGEKSAPTPRPIVTSRSEPEILADRHDRRGRPIRVPARYVAYSRLGYVRPGGEDVRSRTPTSAVTPFPLEPTRVLWKMHDVSPPSRRRKERKF
jgi:hypothetical protein